MLKKILSNTIVRLILAVLIGLLVGLVVNEPVLKAVMIIKQITGQIIFFLVPLIILGFVAPSIARLKSNASKVLLFAFSIAYLSSVGAATFGAVVGYELIPHLHIQTASEDLKDIPPMLFNLEIPPVMSVMSALVLAVMLGLSTAWVKSEEMERLLEVFQNMVLKLVERVLMPVLPLFIAANFCVLSYEGAITKQLPIFLSVLLIVIICHYIWLTLLYVVASIYSRKNSWGVLKYYGPAYLTALGTMSSAATLGTALTCAKKSKILREEVIDVTVPLFANIYLDGSVFRIDRLTNIIWKYAGLHDHARIYHLAWFLRDRRSRRTGRYGARLIGLDHRYSRFRRGRNGIIAYDIRFARQLRYGLQRDGRWCPYLNHGYVRSRANGKGFHGFIRTNFHGVFL